MKALIQRVGSANVSEGDRIVGSINTGMLIFLCVMNGDSDAEASILAKKCRSLRIFDDKFGKMNLSIEDIKGSFLIVSQFTLAANCKRGRRPSFEAAADVDIAKKLYESFCDLCSQGGFHVETGKFAAHMRVQILNDGPVTILLDSNDLA